MNISSMSIPQIQTCAQDLYGTIDNKAIKSHHYTEFETFLQALSQDSRKGVQKLCVFYQKALKNRLNEIYRIEALINFDQGYQAEFLAGVDEVGRGPLAGPVVASCVIMDYTRPIEGVDDSKKLSKQKREALYDEIVEKSLFCAIGEVDNHRIDQMNILNATFSAMNAAITRVSVDMQKHKKNIDLILVDGNQKIKQQNLPQATIIKGDARSYAIACASILAKVYRDRLMEKMDDLYPGYDFASNVGYGSQSHIQGIQQLGLCEIHRKSFCQKLYEGENME